MTKYRITAPETRFNGEFAGLVFRAGEASAETPADQAAVTYCQRRGYTVTAVDRDGEAPPDAEQPATDPAAAASDDDGLEVVVDEPTRPADYAQKGDWVAYAVARGATEEDAQAATKNELIELYG
jgi:hypothetical protein